MGLLFQCLVIATSLVAVIASAVLIRGAREAVLGSSGWTVALSRGAQARTGMRAAVLAGCAVLVILAPTLYGLTGITRAVTGFLGLLVAPGAAVVLFLRLRDPLTELAISVAVSMAALALLAQILLALDTWEPIAAFQAVLLVTAPLLTWHACMTVGLRMLMTEGQGDHARA